MDIAGHVIGWIEEFWPVLLGGLVGVPILLYALSKLLDWLYPPLHEDD